MPVFRAVAAGTEEGGRRDTLPMGRPTASRPQQVAIGGTLARAASCWGLYTLWNFLSALVWAGIFAIALWPFYQRCIRRFGTGRHNILMPAAFTAAVALIFIVPLGLIGVQIAHEARNVTDWVRAGAAERHPRA